MSLLKIVNKAIVLKNIHKQYNDVIVLKDLTLSFDNVGLYLITGRSGSGKTTLLNIIYGILDYEKGDYYLNDFHVTTSLSKTEILNFISYVTQDAYFISYLTIMENLMLISEDENKILELYHQYFINDDLLKRYPSQLSGGEKQRLNVLRCLLKDNKIILLDEPTSNLDSKNSQLLCEMVKKVAQDNLVICVSHDEIFEGYTNRVIDLEKQGCDFEEESTKVIIKQNNDIMTKNKSSYKLVANMIKDKNTKTMNALITFMFSVSLLISFMCFNPTDKIITMLDKQVGLNYINVNCPITMLQECQNEFDTLVYPYGSATSYFDEPIDESESAVVVMRAGDYEPIVEIMTIPFDDEKFKYSDNLAHGTYFINDNDIIIGYNKARQMTSKNIGNLINTPYTINMPSGEVDFNIVGIFNEFIDDQAEYFYTAFGYENYNDSIYLNSSYTSTFLNDGRFALSEIQQEVYRFNAYFDDFSIAYNISKKYHQDKKIDNSQISVDPLTDSYTGIIRSFTQMSLFLIPLIIMGVFITLLFYAQLSILKNTYNSEDLCVYEYCGFKRKQIITAISTANVIKLAIIFLVALIFAIVISLISNYYLYVNNQLIPLFTIDIFISLIIFALIVLVSIIINFLFFKKIKVKTWYQLLIEKRDLL